MAELVVHHSRHRHPPSALAMASFSSLWSLFKLMSPSRGQRNALRIISEIELTYHNRYFITKKIRMLFLSFFLAPRFDVIDKEMLLHLACLGLAPQCGLEYMAQRLGLSVAFGDQRAGVKTAQWAPSSFVHC